MGYIGKAVLVSAVTVSAFAGTAQAAPACLKLSEVTAKTTPGEIAEAASACYAKGDLDGTFALFVFGKRLVGFYRNTMAEWDGVNSVQADWYDKLPLKPDEVMKKFDAAMDKMEETSLKAVCADIRKNKWVPEFQAGYVAQLTGRNAAEIKIDKKITTKKRWSNSVSAGCDG